MYDEGWMWVPVMDGYEDYVWVRVEDYETEDV